MSAATNATPRRVLQTYYAATIVFLMLDYGMGLNVRTAGLEGLPNLKAGYYLVIFACLGLTLWRPAWSTAVGVVESLATLVTLIFSVALRSMIPTGQMLDTGTGVLGVPELVNFLIAGSIAWYAWQRGMTELFGRAG
ncbi:MAG TPA: hypothetical protein VLS87_02050 [Woeseiaceae bacterium]|nr:hypothetical protein [Woeseiaceae bacterium]